VAAPALTQLDDIAADMAAVKGSWVVYQDFLAERDALAHKDWLSMRDQVRAASRSSEPCQLPFISRWLPAKVVSGLLLPAPVFSGSLLLALSRQWVVAASTGICQAHTVKPHTS
jgi:hypothetical protein